MPNLLGRELVKEKGRVGAVGRWSSKRGKGMPGVALMTSVSALGMWGRVFANERQLRPKSGAGEVGSCRAKVDANYADTVKGKLTQKIVRLTRSNGDPSGRIEPSIGEGSRPSKNGLNCEGPAARRPDSSGWPW